MTPSFQLYNQTYNTLQFSMPYKNNSPHEKYLSIYTHLSEFGTGFFLLHPSMGHQVIKNLSWGMRKADLALQPDTCLFREYRGQTNIKLSSCHQKTDY